MLERRNPPLNVLVVDDEFAVLEVLAMAIEGQGHRVIKASDGADALRLLATESCDVVLCDEHMTGMNGLELIAALHADPKRAGLSVILMADSFGPSPPDLKDVVVAPKPIRLADLFALIERAGMSRRAP